MLPASRPAERLDDTDHARAKMADGTPPLGAIRLARAAFWGLLAVVSVLALYPRLSLPEPELTRGSTAYYNHVLAFVTLMIAGAIAWPLGRRLVVALAAYAVLLEMAQSFSPGRETALDDLAASFAGLGLGLVLAALLRGARHRNDRRSASAP